jgi:hypothetical protein
MDEKTKTTGINLLYNPANFLEWPDGQRFGAN